MKKLGLPTVRTWCDTAEVKELIRYLDTGLVVDMTFLNKTHVYPTRILDIIERAKNYKASNFQPMPEHMPKEED